MDISGINLNTNDNLNIDKGTLIIIFNKYREFVLPIMILIVSVIILFFVVFPEINQYSVSRQQLEVETQKLNVLTNNYNFLTEINQTQAESDLKLLTKTFPTEKDFVGIMTAVSAASSKIGISLSDFRFSLGNLSKSSSDAKVLYPTIQMDLKTEGNAIILNNFVNELYKTVPLVEVSGIKYKDNKATLVLQFYYKSFPPQSISDENPVTKLTAKDQNLIKDLYAWNNLSVQDGLLLSGIDFVSATASSNINFMSSGSSEIKFSPF